MPGLWHTYTVQGNGFAVQFFVIDTTLLAEESSQTQLNQMLSTGEHGGSAGVNRFLKNASRSERQLARLTQIDWLQRTLSESEAEWKVVVGHYGVFSGGRFATVLHFTLSDT